MKTPFAGLLALVALVLSLVDPTAAGATEPRPAAVAVAKDARGDVKAVALRPGYESYSTKPEVDVLRTTYAMRGRVLVATITTARLDRRTLRGAQRYIIWSLQGRVRYPDGTTGYFDASHVPGNTGAVAEQDVPIACPTRFRPDLARDTVTFRVDLSECAGRARAITLFAKVHGIALKDGVVDETGYALHRDKAATRTLRLG